MQFDAVHKSKCSSIRRLHHSGHKTFLAHDTILYSIRMEQVANTWKTKLVNTAQTQIRTVRSRFLQKQAAQQEGTMRCTGGYVSDTSM